MKKKNACERMTAGDRFGFGTPRSTFTFWGRKTCVFQDNVCNPGRKRLRGKGILSEIPYAFPNERWELPDVPCYISTKFSIERIFPSLLFFPSWRHAAGIPPKVRTVLWCRLTFPLPQTAYEFGSFPSSCSLSVVKLFLKRFCSALPVLRALYI